MATARMGNFKIGKFFAPTQSVKGVHEDPCRIPIIDFLSGRGGIILQNLR